VGFCSSIKEKKHGDVQHGNSKEGREPIVDGKHEHRLDPTLRESPNSDKDPVGDDDHLLHRAGGGRWVRRLATLVLDSASFFFFRFFSCVPEDERAAAHREPKRKGPVKGGRIKNEIEEYFHD
jgi:hypothetical protein